MDQEDRLDRLSQEWHQQRSDLDITPWQIWGRVTRINDIFLAKLSRILSSHQINYTELQTLGALIVSGPPYESTPNAMSRHNLLTSGGMTNVLTRMEKKGLVTRRKAENDRRSVVVSVTEKGLETFNSAIEQENAVEHKLLEGITREERQVVSVVLRKILRGIDEEDLAG